jgi:hypothetical protein
LAIVLSVLQYTNSDYPFGIFKLFLQHFQIPRLLFLHTENIQLHAPYQKCFV